MFMKEVIFHRFYFGRLDSLKKLNKFLAVFTLGRCGGLKRTDFLQFLL